MYCFLLFVLFVFVCVILLLVLFFLVVLFLLLWWESLCLLLSVLLMMSLLLDLVVSSLNSSGMKGFSFSCLVFFLLCISSGMMWGSSIDWVVGKMYGVLNFVGDFLVLWLYLV